MSDQWRGVDKEIDAYLDLREPTMGRLRTLVNRAIRHGEERMAERIRGCGSLAQAFAEASAVLLPDDAEEGGDE